MASILITGGAGFIGSHLAETLLDEGREVVVLDSFDDFYDPAVKRKNLEGLVGQPGFALVEGDIRDGKLVESVFSSHPIGVVVHLAARAGVRPSIQQPLLYADVNVNGTVVLLEACRHHGIGKFIFGSSSSVYGNNSKVPFSEKDEVDRPISPYAATKRAGELICATYHELHQLNIFALRFFTVFGPRQRPEMAIHKFTRLIDRGLPVPRFGDGSTRRDYTYISDIVAGVQRAIERVQGFEIINLGGSQTTSLKDLIVLLEGRLGKKAIIEEAPDQPGDVVATYADVAKARRLLGYEPKVPVTEGLARFVEWYRRPEVSADRPATKPGPGKRR
ncbi:MAG TPA: GDP-mannose 4,6-dehydratase [Candidatus Polarisedimenticolia bacterium]|nr:GDP-mannose 4,6-dehydratase [Candidatus Polarisedimenticolia bacterium]